MINSISLPNELFYIILSNCDGFERENMRLVCKLFNNFKLDSTRRNHPEKYREVLKIKDIEKLFKHHHEDLIRIYTKNHPDEIRNIFLYSCKYGWINMVKETMQSLSNYWNEGMCRACCGGHIDIVKLMIENGANDWNGGMYGACWGGHIDIVKLMMEEAMVQVDGSTNHLRPSLGANDRSQGIYHAGTNQDIIDYLMK